MQRASGNLGLEHLHIATTEHAATVIIFIEYVHGIMHYNSHNKPDYNDMINTLSMNKVMQILHSSPWHHQYFGNVAYYNNVHQYL